MPCPGSTYLQDCPRTGSCFARRACTWVAQGLSDRAGLRRVTRRLKILHIVHRLDLGGLERLVGAIVRLIDRDRFESHIMTLSEFGPLSEGLETHAELHRVSSLPRVSMIWP